MQWLIRVTVRLLCATMTLTNRIVPKASKNCYTPDLTSENLLHFIFSILSSSSIIFSLLSVNLHYNYLYLSLQ